MKTSRRAALAAVTAILAGSMIASPVAADAAAVRSSPDSVTVFQNTWNNPTPNYIAATCLMPLAFADGTTLNAVTGCGQTVTFSITVTKLSVPATWPGWNGPPQAETMTPDILWTGGPVAMTLRFSSPRRIAGFEVQPNGGVIAPFKATYIDASGNVIGQINKNIMGGTGARLIAAKTPPGPSKVDSIVISSNIDFAIARIRFKP